METWAIVITTFFSFVFTLIGWLLSRQIAANDSAVKDLYIKHEQDVARLATLELAVAGQYYNKESIDNLFTMMRQTMKDGFEGVKEQIAELKEFQNGHRGRS